VGEGRRSLVPLLYSSRRVTELEGICVCACAYANGRVHV